MSGIRNLKLGPVGKAKASAQRAIFFFCAGQMST